MMSYLQSLKDEKELLTAKFPQSHAVFRIQTFNLDEISCKFITPSGSIELTGNITVSLQAQPSNYS